MPKGIPKTAAGGVRDAEYPEDGVLRKAGAVRRQRAVAKSKRRNTRRKDYDPEVFDLPYTHPELFTGGYSPEKKIQALSAWMITGTASEAARMTGISVGTICSWKNKSTWWPALMAEMNKDYNAELDVLYTNVLMKSAKKLITVIDNGEDIYNARMDKMVKRQLSGVSLAKINSHVFASRALMRGDPTQRIEKVSSKERLSMLSQEFEKFSKARDVTAESVAFSGEEEAEDDVEEDFDE